jgi:hypothetical protein
MTWEYLKIVIGEVEEVILKAAAAISLFLFVVDVLTEKILELIKGWKNKANSSTRK